MREGKKKKGKLTAKFDNVIAAYKLVLWALVGNHVPVEGLTFISIWQYKFDSVGY